MRITCPHCGFTKELETGQIPANVVRVNCPDCRQAFALAAEPIVEPETMLIADQAATEPESAEATTIEEDQAGEALVADEPVEPATIVARYAALLIDSMLIMIMVLIVRVGLTMLGNGIRLEGQIILGLIFMLFALTLGFAYHTLFIGVCGQTPGKRLLRIRVVVTDASAMTYRRAMLREVLGKVLSFPLLLGYIMAMFNPRHLTAHDKIANTCVVKLTTEPPLA